jgi:Tfp pilus assembly protein PilP
VKAARWLGVALLLTTIAAAQAEDAAPPGAAQAAEETDGQLQAPSYNPAGRRDPFRPFTLLQRYDLGQLSVVGTVWELSPPRAMVEDSVGMGYIVTVGTPIGRNGGVVTAIEPQRVVVEERVLDFYGKEQVNRIVMETPKEGTN